MVILVCKRSTLSLTGVLGGGVSSLEPAIEGPALNSDSKGCVTGTFVRDMYSASY